MVIWMRNFRASSPKVVQRIFSPVQGGSLPMQSRNFVRQLVFLSLILPGSVLLADEVADVKAAATSYVEAVSVRDAARMKACCTADSGQLIDGFVKMAASFQKLNDAGIARFKEQITENQFAARDAKEVEAADVTVNGDAATLAIKREGGALSRPVVLKREGGAWKVHLAANMRSAPERIIAFFAASSQAADETAGEISGGKYGSAEEARTALREKIGTTLRRQSTAPSK
jgi:hypothetical protein